MKKLIKNIRRLIEKNEAGLGDLAETHTDGYVLTLNYAENKKAFKRLQGLFQFDPQTASTLSDASAFGGKLCISVDTYNKRVSLSVKIKGQPAFEREFYSSQEIV